MTVAMLSADGLCIPLGEAHSELRSGPSRDLGTLEKKKKSADSIPDTLISEVVERLAANRRVRRTLPRRGRLHIDRQLPFLCVYRYPADHADAGTKDFVRSEASYLIVSGGKKLRRDVTALIDRVVSTLAPEFGAFLVIEIWAGPQEVPGVDPRSPHVPPGFRVLAPPSSTISPTVDTLASNLKKVRVLKQSVEVEIERTTRTVPPGLAPLLSAERARQLGCTIVGIEVPPVWRDPKSDQGFPLLQRTLRRRLSQAFQRAIYEFADGQTTHTPAHYHALGRRAVVKAVWDVDAQLAKVSSSFDFLLQVTPVNSDAAWNQFRSSRFQQTPDFHYLPTPMDPALLKRQLYRVPIERVEDPALHHVFQQKQEELDRKITMLRDRNSRSFLYGSLQLYGAVSDDLYGLAAQLLEQTPSRTKDESKSGQLDAKALAGRAEKEFEYYRAQSSDFAASTEVSSKAAGIMVSRGKLLINKNLKTAPERVEPLLHHEIGTHLLTYYNGRAQPFRQLYSGLAGYDELQEGLAVLAEYLVGGLSRPRIRQLAARVVASRHLVDGASFVETFRELDHNHDFSQRTAFTITMRVYRGGGLTKDAVYLRGLRTILRYLGKGGDIDPLLVGKFAAEHVPIIKELQFRKVLRPPPLRPRYLDDPQAVQRLQKVRAGMTVVDLVKHT